EVLVEGAFPVLLAVVTEVELLADGGEDRLAGSHRCHLLKGGRGRRRPVCEHNAGASGGLPARRERGWEPPRGSGRAPPPGGGCAGWRASPGSVMRNKG